MHLDASRKWSHELLEIVVYLTADLLNSAATLLPRYRNGTPQALRSLDSIQLASSLAARDTLLPEERQEMRFVTADKQLLGCALDEGFLIINPLSPPVP